MLKIMLACFALLFAGCDGKPECDSGVAKKLVMESVEKTVKKQLAIRLNPSISGDEWQNALSPEEKEMVEYNYKEYGPILANIASIEQGKNEKAVACSAELRFRNSQKFNLFYTLQKDTNGKLHAMVEWR